MAITKPNGRREARGRGSYTFPGLTIQVERTETLIPAHENQCPCGFLFQLAGGELVVGGPRTVEPELTWRRSRDGGRTWYAAPSWPSFYVHQFDDGELLHVGTPGDPWLTRGDQPGAYRFPIYRSHDNGHTHAAESALISGVPQLAEDESEQWGRHVFAYVDHGLVTLRDGSLLATVLGKFAGDIKHRVFVIHSDDRGATWRYRASVAFDLNPTHTHRIEGFTEPDLLALPNGDVLCFMRTGGRYEGQHTALAVSRSADDGQSWSAPEPVADRGVLPKACRMSNGVLAVIYGRPGDWLAFSRDDGHTWIGHTCLNLGTQAWDCGNYDWIIEVAPDTLLAAYAETDRNDPRRSSILGTWVTVKPT